jgi:hypothetical protein
MTKRRPRAYPSSDDHAPARHQRMIADRLGRMAGSAVASASPRCAGEGLAWEPAVERDTRVAITIATPRVRDAIIQHN